MKRDQVLGVIAAIVAVVSAFLPWIVKVTVLYDADGKSALTPIQIPISFLFSGAGTGDKTSSEPALLAVVLAVAGGLLIWTFLPRGIRRVLYLIWGLLAVAAPVLVYLQLQNDVAAKHLDTSAFTHLGLGAFLCAGAGLVALVAGIIGAGKKEAATPAVPVQPEMAMAAAPGYGAPYAHPAPTYGQPTYEQQQWGTQTGQPPAAYGQSGYSAAQPAEGYGPQHAQTQAQTPYQAPGDQTAWQQPQPQPQAPPWQPAQDQWAAQQPQPAQTGWGEQAQAPAQQWQTPSQAPAPPAGEQQHAQPAAEDPQDQPAEAWPPPQSPGT